MMCTAALHRSAVEIVVVAVIAVALLCGCDDSRPVAEMLTPVEDAATDSDADADDGSDDTARGEDGHAPHDGDTDTLDEDTALDAVDTTPPACLELGAPCAPGDTCCNDAICDVETGRCRTMMCLPDDAACELDYECCSGFCHELDGCCSTCECSSLGWPCRVDDDCCLGLVCTGGACQLPCRPTGATCELDGNCCGGSCDPIEGLCFMRECGLEGATCEIEADCCQGTVCFANRCREPCVGLSEACTFDGDCCSGYCSDMGQCDYSPECSGFGVPCSGQIDCCEGLVCHPKQLVCVVL